MFFCEHERGVLLRAREIAVQASGRIGSEISIYSSWSCRRPDIHGVVSPSRGVAGVLYQAVPPDSRSRVQCNEGDLSQQHMSPRNNHESKSSRGTEQQAQQTRHAICTSYSLFVVLVYTSIEVAWDVFSCL